MLLIASATVRFAGVALLLGFTSRFPSPGVPAGSFVLPKVCDALDEMRRERNLIAHGVWTIRFGGGSQGEAAMPPAGLPMVLWHSKMLESDDFVTAESFHFWRFDKFMDRARVLLNTFLQFRTMAENAIEAEKRSRRL